MCIPRFPDIAFDKFQMIISDLDGILKDIDAPLAPELDDLIKALGEAGFIHHCHREKLEVNKSNR